MLPVALATAPAANAAGVGAGLSITPDDVKFILEQIQISEAHATKVAGPGGALIAPTSVVNCTVLPCVTDPTLPHGLRQVSGRQNNLFQNAPVTTAMEAAVAADLGAADRPFPRLGPVNWRATEAGTFPGVPLASTTYQSRGVSVQDAQPRVISNLVADQNPTTNGAALAASGGAAVDTPLPALDPNLQPPGASAQILNVPPGGLPAPGQPALAPTSGMFTLFGQFFDHGLDLVGKTSTEVVVIPLDASDPLFVVGGPTNFMMANRTVVDGNLDGQNATTPWIDQNQTYGSHASKQVFMREFVLNGVGDPVDTGKLLGDALAQGYVANWAETKAQARNVLGINLVDSDVFNVPLILTDEYGNFLPGVNGNPQLVTTGGPVEGIPGAGAISTATAVRTGHAFLDDIAHNAVPAPGKAADADAALGLTGPSATNYDNEMLDQHFITGDGRGNENIGLTAVHTMFHAEHNRLVDDINSIVTADVTLNAGFNAAGSWTRQQRLFQAARFVNEMEYQHAVFEEFARTFSPAIRPFAAYDPLLQPDIPAEFAHAVYRFGHSMLRENVERTRANGTDDSMRLLDAFLNPPSFKAGYADASAAAGSIARGMNNQRSSEIDEFVTSSLRNSLLGLPLDLPALNIARGRDTGTPSLNQMRVAMGLAPYTSWTDFGSALRHGESLVNFIAAYGDDPLLTAAGNNLGLRRAAALTLNGTPAFMNGASGLADIDLWMGGLAERRNEIAGNLLGPTFNAVFAVTMENLQEGDRFYYLDRLAGLNLLTSIEGNTLSEMFVRNTDAEVLPANLFAVPSVTIDLRTMPGTVPFPVLAPGDGTISEIPATGGYNRDVTYTGLLNVTIGGTSPTLAAPTAGRDHIRGGSGDDTIRANDGDDWVHGGDGADVTIGGNGDDIVINTGGADNMIGGPGDDVFNGGPDGDVMNGNTGHDYMFTGALGAITLGGSGNERQLGGIGSDGLTGDDGDDWLEGGDAPDALDGDTIAPFGVDINTPGEDVLIGGPGTGDAYDGGGRMDVFVGQSNVAPNGTVIPQIDDYLGGLGFDWTTYFGSRTPNADTANFAAALPANDPGLLLDSFIDVEALSGGDFADTLNGDDRTTLAGNAPGISDGMPAGDVASIDGLAALLGAAAVSGWNNGNILIGGAGSDTLQGRGGDDLLDGDAYLTVGLSVPNGPSQANAGPGNYTTPQDRTVVSSLTSLVGGVTTNSRILSGEVNPADMFAVKTISNVAQPGTDVAVFSGNSNAYTVTGSGALFTVSGPDGTDIVRNIETLQFANTSGTPASFVGQAPVTPPVTPVTPPASGGGSGDSGAAATPPAASTPAAPAATTPAAPVTNPVTPPAASVPAVTAVTLTVTKAPSSKVATAPSVSAKAGQKVTLKLTGLKKSAQYGAKVKINGKWVSLGSFKSTKAGKATLKPFTASSAGTYTVMLTDSKGKKSYVKVIAS